MARAVERWLMHSQKATMDARFGTQNEMPRVVKERMMMDISLQGVPEVTSG